MELKLPPAQPDRLRPVNELVKALRSGETRTPLRLGTRRSPRRVCNGRTRLLRYSARVRSFWPRYGRRMPVLFARRRKTATPWPRASRRVRRIWPSRAASLKRREPSSCPGRCRTTARHHPAVIARCLPGRRLVRAVGDRNGPRAPGGLRGQLRKSLRELIAVPASPNLGLDFSSLVPALRAAATPKESPALAALTSLHNLREQSRRLRKRQTEQVATGSTHSALKRMLEIADTTIKAAVEDALKPIQDLAARYFGVLMVDDIYRDIELVSRLAAADRSSVSVVFTSHRSPLSPPQRIMSESQLNALGIALLLARLKHEEQEWRTLVLDDVVNGFDAPAHRQGLLRLLKDEFSDWQVIVFSHNSAFRDVAMQASEGGWTFLEIVKWTPGGGPVLGDGDPLDRLESELADGAASSGLGGFARAALEGGLSRPLMKLGYRELRYDPKGRFSAEYFSRSGRGVASSMLTDHWLILMSSIAWGGANYMATTIVHRRDGASEPNPP